MSDLRPRARDAAPLDTARTVYLRTSGTRVQTMPRAELRALGDAFAKLGCTVTGVRRLKAGAGVIVELRQPSEKTLCLGKRIVAFGDLELRVYEHVVQSPQPVSTAAVAPPPHPALQELDFNRILSLIASGEIASAMALLTRNSVAPHEQLLRRLIRGGSVPAPMAAVLIGQLAAPREKRTCDAIFEALRSAVADARSAALSMNDAALQQLQLVATVCLVGELRVLVALSDEATMAIVAPLRATAAPPTVPDAMAACALLPIVQRAPSNTQILVELVALIDSFAATTSLPPNVRSSCAAASAQVKLAQLSVLAPLAHATPAAPAPAPPTPTPDLYTQVFGAELASQYGDKLRLAHFDRAVLQTLAAHDQSACVNMLTNSVGIAAGHAILMAHSLARWKN